MLEYLVAGLGVIAGGVALYAGWMIITGKAGIR